MQNISIIRIKQKYFLPSMCFFVLQKTSYFQEFSFKKAIKKDKYQPFVPGINHCIEHGLVEKAVTHPLWYDDVYSLHR